MSPDTQKSGLARLIHTIKQSLFGKSQDYTKGDLHTCILMLAVPMMLEMSILVFRRGRWKTRRI